LNVIVYNVLRRVFLIEYYICPKCGIQIQSPLCSIIYDREIHIENFKSTPYWDVYADFHIDGHTYRGKWFTGDTEHISYKQKADALMEVIKDKPAFV
jgi:DNA topoisomerase-3